MSEKGIITSISENKIQVLPLLKDSCATCTANCEKKEKAIFVENPKNFDLKVGMFVIIAAKKSLQYLQGFTALLLPVCAAICGYFFSSFLFKFLNKTATEGIRAIFVLLFFFLSSAIIFFVTRKKPLPGSPEIIEIF